MHAFSGSRSAVARHRAIKRTNEQMRAVQRRMKEADRKLLEVQSALRLREETLAALQDAVAAVRRTHDDMAALFQHESEDIG